MVSELGLELVSRVARDRFLQVKETISHEVEQGLVLLQVTWEVVEWLKLDCREAKSC